MKFALERQWRVAATGFCFMVFGLGGLVTRVLLFPLLNLLVRRVKLRIEWARMVIHLSFKFFVRLMIVTGIFNIRIQGAERLRRQGLLILANHPTLIDVVILMSVVRHADCVVRSGLRNNPFTRGPVRAAGFVSNDNGPGIVDDCIEAIANGSNMIIFPEGSRTVPGKDLAFQRGAANVAVRGAIDVTPVVIHCSPTFLPKGRPWYKVPFHRPRFVIEVKDDISVRPFIETGDEATLAARRFTHHLQTFFSEELRHYAGIGTGN